MTTIYIIERQGQPVALADAVGRADALRLYIDSLDVSARVASTRDVLTHRSLPLLQRADEAPERDPLTGDMFGGAQAEVSTEQPAAAQEVAAEHPVEPQPAAATSAPAPDSTTDLEGQVSALAARLARERPRLPPDVLPLELLQLCGVTNPRLGDSLPWPHAGRLDRLFWAVYHQARASAGRGTGVPVKYRDPATGEAWSGRGLKPRWLADALAAGRTLADFEV